MNYIKTDNIYVVRLDIGDEILSSLTQLCNAENICTAAVQGIGAVDNVTVGFYSTEEKKYFSKTFNQQFEIVSLNGNVTRKDDEPYLHLHIALSDGNYNVCGGHLNSAVVSVTAEIFITVLSETVSRKVNSETKLNIFDI